MTKPISPLQARSFSKKDRPFTNTSPPSRWIRFSMAFMVVVFPAPFRPMKPMMYPGSREKLTLSKVKVGYRFSRSRTSNRCMVFLLVHIVYIRYAQ